MFWNRKKEKRVINVEGMNVTLTRFLGDSKNFIQAKSKEYGFDTVVHVRNDGTFYSTDGTKAFDSIEDTLLNASQGVRKKALEEEETDRMITDILNGGD